MDGKLKGHAALWVANIIWGLNAPIGKSVLWSETHPQGVNPFALSVYRMLGACLLFWTVSLFLPREKVAPRDIVLLLFASVFGIQLNQMLFLWGLSLTSPIDTSIIATIVPVLTMILATLFLREPIIGLFVDDSGVITYGVQMLIAYMLSGPFIGFLFVNMNCMQSVGRALPATVLSVLRQGLLLIPLLYLLNAVFGLNGAVLGQSITDYVTIALSCVVWRRIRYGLEQRT